jgi:hypothetical protein
MERQDEELVQNMTDKYQRGEETIAEEGEIRKKDRLFRIIRNTRLRDSLRELPLALISRIFSEQKWTVNEASIVFDFLQCYVEHWGEESYLLFSNIPVHQMGLKHVRYLHRKNYSVLSVRVPDYLETWTCPKVLSVAIFLFLCVLTCLYLNLSATSEKNALLQKEVVQQQTLHEKAKEEISNADANNMLLQKKMVLLESAHESLISGLYGKLEILGKPKLEGNWTKDELEAIRSKIEREVGDLRHNYTEALAENRGLREKITKEKEASNNGGGGTAGKIGFFAMGLGLKKLLEVLFSKN